VATATTYRWILATTSFKWILATTTARVLALLPHLLTMDIGCRHRGHLQLEGMPAVENASVDDTDAAAAATFFFTTDGKSFVPTFNCSIHNTNKCRTSRLLVHFCLQASFVVSRTRICRWGPKHGRIQRGSRRWQRPYGTVIELCYICDIFAS
jgi:hypothetical protein